MWDAIFRFIERIFSLYAAFLAGEAHKKANDDKANTKDAMRAKDVADSIVTADNSTINSLRNKWTR